MNGAHLQDIDRVNLHPLNRISKVWLEKAGVAPDPAHLHVLSLINWALGERAIEIDTTGDPFIAGQTQATLLEMATKWHPTTAMDFLAGDGSGPPSIDLNDLAEAGSPVDAALKLLGCLTNAIVANRTISPSGLR